MCEIQNKGELMSISDTQAAKKYASIAEVAAAQAKVYALELETAPDYASQAEEAAEQALSASSAASQYAQNASGAASSAATSASAADTAASEAAEAAESAIGQTVRAPQGESLSELPAASSRTNRFIATGAAGDVEMVDRESIPVLDSNGKIPVSMIPAIALTEPFVVNSQSAMLALSAQPGDIAKRTDLGYSFCLAASPASTLSNWVQLTDDVLAQLGLSSGAGMIGATSISGGSSTVQAELSKKINSAELAASGGSGLIGATNESGSPTTVAEALNSRPTSAALLAANGSGIGFRYAPDASLLNIQSRLVQNLFIDDYVQAVDNGDYSLALNRIFTKFANATGFTINFGIGTYSLKTQASYSGTAEIYLCGQNSTTLSLDATGFAANLSIVSTRRITMENMNVIGTPPSSAGTKIGIFLNCTNQDVSHTLRSVRATAAINTSGCNIIMFDIVNPSLSSFSDCYVRYSGSYSLVSGSNNIAFRLRALSKISTDSMFRNCSVVGCEISFVVIPPVGGVNGAYLEGITWIGCTIVSVLQGVYIVGDNSNAYRSPMYRWIGGHINAYQRCIYIYWASQIVIDGAFLYLPFSSTYSGSLGLFPIWLEQTVETHINNTGFQMSGQASGSGHAVHIAPGAKNTSVANISCYNDSKALSVVSYSGSYYSRCANCLVFYSGTAPSSSVSLNGNNDVDLGGNAVYAQ